MPVEGAAYCYATTVEGVEVLFGGLQTLVPEDLLDPPGIDSRFEEVGGEGVAESMASSSFGDTAQPDRTCERFLQATWMTMESHEATGFGVVTKGTRWKYELPFPFTWGSREFSIQGIG